MPHAPNQDWVWFCSWLVEGSRGVGSEWLMNVARYRLGTDPTKHTFRSQTDGGEGSRFGRESGGGNLWSKLPVSQTFHSRIPVPPTSGYLSSFRLSHVLLSVDPLANDRHLSNPISHFPVSYFSKSYPLFLQACPPPHQSPPALLTR